MCFSSGDRYDEDWRKYKQEWIAYDEYKKAKEEKFKKKTRGYYQKEELVLKRKTNLEAMLTCFAAASEKSHDEIDAAMRDQQAMMKDQLVLMRNQQASILKTAC